MQQCYWVWRRSTDLPRLPKARRQLVATPIPSLASASFNLTMLHTNDIHCRFEEANKIGGACKQRDSEDGNCFGGYARLVHRARKIREQHPDTIFLNGGDFFQGTI
ncbi:hypothetical protein OUZ56_011376 [Daphnia magna]|uniref:5'-nucleotidase n=1 Tax=Daphnia magna TaxID=35525 RepID=A0ABQ9Z059_9CRUS|nr:hypothetical protein OUZ56_011376 [Daphnia magna]